MLAFRLTTTLCVASALLVACEQKPAAGGGQALVAAIAQSASECTQAVRSIGGRMENSIDPNLVAAARDACNASSAAIANLTTPEDATPEQAELYASSLHECSQAQSNIAELLGMAIGRRSMSNSDQSRMNRVANQDRQKACIEGLEQALASSGGKLSRTDRMRLTPSMPGFF